MCPRGNSAPLGSSSPLCRARLTGSLGPGPCIPRGAQAQVKLSGFLGLGHSQLSSREPGNVEGAAPVIILIESCSELGRTGLVLAPVCISCQMYFFDVVPADFSPVAVQTFCGSF